MPVRADFRKDYQQIGGVVRERFGGLPITALTATATARVQADVKRSLGMEDCVCFQVMPLPQGRPFYVPSPSSACVMPSPDGASLSVRMRCCHATSIPCSIVVIYAISLLHVTIAAWNGCMTRHVGPNTCITGFLHFFRWVSPTFTN